MRLKLTIAGKFIASIPLDATEALNLEYIHSKRYQLAESCSMLIQSQTETPVYYIEVPSKMNPTAKD